MICDKVFYILLESKLTPYFFKNSASRYYLESLLDIYVLMNNNRVKRYAFFSIFLLRNDIFFPKNSMIIPDIFTCALLYCKQGKSVHA